MNIARFTPAAASGIRRRALVLALMLPAALFSMANAQAQTPIGYIMQTYAGDQSLGAGESGDAGPANQAQLTVHSRRCGPEGSCTLRIR